MSAALGDQCLAEDDDVRVVVVGGAGDRMISEVARAARLARIALSVVVIEATQKGLLRRTIESLLPDIDFMTANAICADTDYGDCTVAPVFITQWALLTLDTKALREEHRRLKGPVWYS